MHFNRDIYSGAWQEYSIVKLLLGIESYSKKERDRLYTSSLKRLNKLIKKHDTSISDDNTEFTILFNLAALGVIVLLINKEAKSE